MASAGGITDRRMIAGISCGVGAGAVWGLVFVAPEMVYGFSPLELAVGRYLAYGFISVALLASRWRPLTAGLSRRDWLMLAFLALTGNSLYYLLLSAAVQTGGIAITALIMGFLPVAVTIIGSRETHAVTLKALIPSLLLCLAGAGAIGLHAIDASVESTTTHLMGLLCAIAALVTWTVYAVLNARALTRLSKVSPYDWSLLVGVVAGAQAMLMVPAVAIHSPQHSVEQWLQFGLVSIGVALLASVIGNGLWNKMSRLLPMTMGGQMILFETLFALLYSFVWESRLPDWLEVIAFLLVAGSVISCIGAHRRHQAGLA